MAVRLVQGKNDLASRYSELAKEAHGWNPSTVFPGYNKKLDWICEKGHIYQQSPNKRTSRGYGCSICSNFVVLIGYNDLKSKFPEVAAEADGWDPEKVVWGSNQKKAWKCRHGHTWEAMVATRTQGKGCPYCAGRYVWEGFNDLASQQPEIANEAHGWDPRTVHVGSNKRLDWKCSLGHVFSAAVSDRTGDDPRRQTGCPYCTNKKVLPGFNDLATKFPKLAQEADGWDPTQVLSGSHKKMSWKCELGHTWTVKIDSRTAKLKAGQACGCPYCGNREVWPGFNDLLSQYPKFAKQADGWDPEKVTWCTSAKRTWRCELAHTWEATVRSRVRMDLGCPICANQILWKGFNDLATHFQELAKEADGWDPTNVIRGANKKKKWKCIKGHTWFAVVAQRCNAGTGCPECAEYGFNKGKPTWFYLMERPGEQQFGISNDIKDRLNHHGREGWIEIEVVGPYPGEEVLALETKFRRWLASNIGAVKGTRENWSTTKLEVRSLAELKEASGIETSWF